jgi:Protein of unknown function (DUF402)
MRWRHGDVIVRREIWNGRPWMGSTVRVVRDEETLLATYTPEGTPFEFPDGAWPEGRHPWHGRPGWQGHGKLMLQRPGDAYAVWVFWSGPTRELACWYLNLQAPFRRTEIGYDTYDHELDLVVEPDGSWWLKDDDQLDERIRAGRFTEHEAAAIRAEGERLAGELAAGRRWWDESWAEWEPDPDWAPAPLPEGWDVV